MRIIRLFAATMFIAAIAVIPAFAQQRGGAAGQPPASAQTGPTGPVPSSKIAYVDTEAFSDEKTGITRYVAALNSLQREFQPRQTELQTLANRIKAIADELTKLTGNQVVAPKTIDDKREEGEKLQRELEYKKKEYDAALAKRYDDVVSPISQDIGNALIAFAKQRGITMTFDISKLAGAILTLDRSMDITSEFVTEYNSKNPATASTAAPGR